MIFFGLLENETLRVWKKKRFLVVVLLLLVLIPVFTYAQYKSVKNIEEKMGTTDWHVQIQQQIIDYQNRLTSPRLPEEWRGWIKVQMQQLEYYLEHDINPKSMNGVTFMRIFIQQANTLFIPLLIVVIASDIVSEEYTGGTIKLLVTRGVKRSKILLSKYFVLIFYVSITLFLTGLFAYLISALPFGYHGFQDPILVGFQIMNEEVDTTNVHLVPQWYYILLQYGLAWYVNFFVATFTLMVSVLVQNTATSMGIMLAAIISGNTLMEMAASWPEAKYIPFVNFNLTDYLAGSLPPISGMNLSFSLTNLTFFAILSLIVAFSIFRRKDILA